MKKVLVITSVASMVDQFLMPNIRLLQDMGYEVHVACNFEQGNTCSNERIDALKKALQVQNTPFFQVDFARNVADLRAHCCAYRQVSGMVSSHRYDLIHCHSPIGGLVTRLAARKYRKEGTKVIYTAHGFHFFKGAPIKNWLLYYPAEKLCARLTDVLITINREDHVFAKKHMKAKRVAYIPGVGVDVARFAGEESARKAKRQELGIPEQATLLLSVGELNENKNHETVIRALEGMDLYYLIAGKGRLQMQLQEQIDQKGMTEQIKLLGFRTDVSDLYDAADLFVFPSFREGLSVSLMEAMASGKAVCCSKIRGNTDLIDSQGGTLFDPYSVESCKAALHTVLKGDMDAMGIHNRKVIEAFSVEAVLRDLQKLYASL